MTSWQNNPGEGSPRNHGFMQNQLEVKISKDSLDETATVQINTEIQVKQYSILASVLEFITRMFSNMPTPTKVHGKSWSESL